MTNVKDRWDKFDIGARIADVIIKALVTIIVACLLWSWNSTRTSLQTASAMTEIAVGILSEKPDSGESDPLRNWAIAVLQNPKDPPVLSSEAAMQLKSKDLKTVDGNAEFTAAAIIATLEAMSNSGLKLEYFEHAD